MGWKRITFFVAVIAALVCCRSKAAEPAECRWTEEKISIDGVADEACWAKAQLIDNFQMYWKKEGERKPMRATKARLLWDREYTAGAALTMGDIPLGTAAGFGVLGGSTVTNTGPSIVNANLGVSPGAAVTGFPPGVVVNGTVNAANATLDQFFVKRESNGFGKLNETYPFELKTAVKLRGTLNKRDDKDEGWSVEGRIPWKNFAPAGGRPGVGETWKFALCRYDYDINSKQPELSCSAPLTASRFHQYEDYAPLKFVGPGGDAIRVGLGSVWLSNLQAGNVWRLDPRRIEATLAPF